MNGSSVCTHRQIHKYAQVHKYQCASSPPKKKCAEKSHTLPERTLSEKAFTLSSTSHTCATTSTPSTISFSDRGARRAVCRTDLPEHRVLSWQASTRCKEDTFAHGQVNASFRFQNHSALSQLIRFMFVEQRLAIHCVRCRPECYAESAG